MHSIKILVILIVFELNTFRKKFKNLLIIKTIQTNIFRIQANNLVMCQYFCIGFIDFMLKDKSITDFTNFFSPTDFKKNDDMILNYF